MLAAVLALLADFDLPKRPDLEPDSRFGTDPTPYLILFGVGFLVGVLGHLFKVKLMIAIGILLIFMATVVLPLYLQLSQ
jgi:hypothetical protein